MYLIPRSTRLIAIQAMLVPIICLNHSRAAEKETLYPDPIDLKVPAISSDKSIKYETVVQVMDNLQKAGVSRVGLSVQTGSK